MKVLLISSAAFAALILTSVTADARGFRGGGFHGAGFRGGGFRGGGSHDARVGGFRGGYRGGVAGYRGGYGRVGRYGYAGGGRYGYGRYGYGYRGYGLAAAGIGAAAAAGYYGSTYGRCGPYAYYDSYSGVCRAN